LSKSGFQISLKIYYFKLSGLENIMFIWYNMCIFGEKDFFRKKRKKNTFIIAALKQEKGGSYG